MEMRRRVASPFAPALGVVSFLGLGSAVGVAACGEPLARLAPVGGGVDSGGGGGGGGDNGGGSEEGGTPGSTEFPPFADAGAQPPSGVGGTVVLAANGIVTAIAIDSTYVYATTQDDVAGQAAAILSAPKLPGSGAPTVLLDGEWVHDPQAIVVNDTNVYIGDIGLESLPLSGGGYQALSSLCFGCNAEALAIDSTDVFFTGSNSGNVTRVSLTAKDGGLFYDSALIAHGTYTTSITLGSGMVFWVDLDDATSTNLLYGLPTSSPAIDDAGTPDGGAPVLIASVPGERFLPGNQAIAQDGTYAYWAVAATGSVMRAPITGGGTPSTFASGQNFPSDGSEVAFAADATNLYWNTSEAIVQAPLAGGSPVTIAARPADPQIMQALSDGTVTLAVGSSYVYWNWLGFVLRGAIVAP
jgi:hypothetical protein